MATRRKARKPVATAAETSAPGKPDSENTIPGTLIEVSSYQCAHHALSDLQREYLSSGDGTRAGIVSSIIQRLESLA